MLLSFFKRNDCREIGDRSGRGAQFSQRQGSIESGETKLDALTPGTSQPLTCCCWPITVGRCTRAAWRPQTRVLLCIFRGHIPTSSSNANRPVSPGTKLDMSRLVNPYRGSPGVVLNLRNEQTKGSRIGNRVSETLYNSNPLLLVSSARAVYI